MNPVLAANRLVLLAAIPLFLILAVIAYSTVRFAADERDAQSWVRHTYQVMEQERRILDDVQQAETSQRGYFLTHDPAFLTGYRAGRTRATADIAAFRAATTDNPVQQQRADRLAGMVRQRFLDQTALAGIAAPGMNQTVELGRVQMAALRSEVTAGLAEETRLLAKRDVQRQQQEQLEIGFAAGAALLTLAILLLAAGLLVRNNLGLAQAESARANEAAVLQATLDNIPSGVAYFASDGRLCTFNFVFFRFLGLAEGLAHGRSSIATIQAALPEPARRLIAPPAAGEAGQKAHLTLDGRELDVYRDLVATGGFLVGIEDVTARMQAEGIVRQSQKMESIGQLTGGVAHDFNNLLQIISANLELAVASGEAKGNPRLGQRLQNAIGAVARGARLTAQLLAFARRQALSPRSLDLGRVIRDMTDLLRRTLGEQIEVEAVVGGGLWNTLVDPTQVENAILNLAINARDAMPKGGKLTLEVANAYLDDDYAARHNEVAPGQYVMLAVSDTGTGMAPEVVGRVFEPFFTTKTEGTGLGLAQAYGFVKQSGGHIKIYSEPGDGTTIKIYLPRTRRPQDIDMRQAGGVQGGNERILVVEDDEGVRAAVVDMLTDLGYRVQRAENAEAALALLRGGADIDLLFTDVVMPGPIPTRDFTRQVQEMRPGVPVLYTSGYTQNAIVHNGRLDDDAALLSKPYRKDELARKLRSVFAGTARGPLVTPAEPAPSAPSRGKVLVVEDEALIRVVAIDMLQELGFDALEAGDGAEALALLEKDPAIGILITDLGLPGMDGHALTVAARQLKPELKVVIASGYSSERDTALRTDETITYLPKPYDLTQLRKALGV